MAPKADPPPYLELAEELADTARTLLQHAQGKYPVLTKADSSPVTQADKDCEAALREILSQQVPEHGIWGEEFGATPAAKTWVLDPIDGTKAFITGSPLFATLIALVIAEKSVLGILEFPALGQRWLGWGSAGWHKCSTGKVTNLRPKTQPDQQPQQLAAAHVAITRPAQSAAVASVVDTCAQVRYGGDAYNYAVVASGLCDIAIDEGLQPYDYAALIPVLEAAGCAWADFAGNQPKFGPELNLIAAVNQQLLDDTLTVMQQC